MKTTHSRFITGILVLIVVMVISKSAHAQTHTSYPFHPTKITRVHPGWVSGPGGFAPYPYNVSVGTEFGSRSPYGGGTHRIYNQRNVNLGAGAIRNAAKLRMLGPASVALGLALAVHDIYFDDQTGDFVGPDPYDWNGNNSNTYSYSYNNADWNDFHISVVAPLPNTIGNGLDWLNTQLPRVRGDWTYHEIVDLQQNGPNRLDVCMRRENSNTGQIQPRYCFTAAFIGTGVGTWWTNLEDKPESFASSPAAVTDEQFFDALNTTLRTGAGPGTWSDFLTDPITGQPLSGPGFTYFDDAADLATAEYNAAQDQQSPEDLALPATDNESQWQFDDSFPVDTGTQPETDTQSLWDFCDENSDLVICAGIGEDLSDVPLGSYDVGFDITPVEFQSGSGQCPAPVSLSVPGGDIEVSYESVCTFAQAISPVTPLVAGLTAIFILIGARKDA